MDNLRKEAKRWLKALRANDPDARARLTRTHPNALFFPFSATCSTRWRASTVTKTGQP